jgi:hypothetical protein
MSAPVPRRKPDASRPAEAPQAVTAVPSPDSPAPPAAAATDEGLPAIDPDSITRAAREVARSTTLSRRSDELIGKAEPPTRQEQLAAGVARAARKDCLKGSVDGDGGYQPDAPVAGLLALPFLIYDAATGKCRR